MVGKSIFLLLVTKIFATAREPDIEPLPRGVPYNRGPLFKKSSEFVCLDGSRSIIYEHVNDDYCDCPDGSDEPGTSACPNAKFHCANKGHTPVDIPSSRVNDRICDCCDGSDEYNGSVQCPNICDELGRSAREQKLKQMEVQRKGYAARKTLAAEGLKLREEKRQAIVPLKQEKEQLLLQKEELLQIKNTAQEKETALKDKHRETWLELCKMKKMEDSKLLFQQIDVDGNQRITLDEIKSLEYLDNNHDGIVSAEEAMNYMVVDSADTDYFFAEMYEKIKQKKLEQEKQSEMQEEENVNDDLVADEDREETEREAEDGVTLESNTSTMPPYDEETLRAIEEADIERKRYNEIDSKINSLDNQIREAELFGEEDFGADYAWSTLKGKCFERTEKQYTYKFCPFDRAVQIEKNGHGETDLGHWKEWSGEFPRKYSKQSYKDGQTCWNGPQRSTEVIIQCGEESELVEASEPVKCEYRFVFHTPAACNDPDREEPTHREL